MGRDSVAETTNLYNIGEGHLTAGCVPAYSIKRINLRKESYSAMVYILDKNGQPLMPSRRYGKVRRLLNTNKAIVVKRCPFVIQLLYETPGITQSVEAGIDAGSRHIGASAIANGREIYASETQLRSDIPELLAFRRELRSGRRNRKTRYRKPRFNNRTHAKKKNPLPPSIRQKVQSHLVLVREMCRILPVTKITVETAAFDLQKLKADLEGLKRPEGVEYQQGEQAGFWNVREYVLHRDGHVCQCCKGKSRDPVLNVHHIESRKTGGNAPNNLITLCETCHTGYHNGAVTLPASIRRGMPMKDAAFMGIMRWAFYEQLKADYPQLEIRLTYGYQTKQKRIAAGLPKSHIIDARCISGHPNAVPVDEVFFRKHMRRHNRQLHKCTIRKGGKRKSNQAPKQIYGFQLYDQVLCMGQEGFVFGRRSSGYFDVRRLNGTKIHAGISYKRLKRIAARKTILQERRCKNDYATNG